MTNANEAVILQCRLSPPGSPDAYKDSGEVNVQCRLRDHNVFCPSCPCLLTPVLTMLDCPGTSDVLSFHAKSADVPPSRSAQTDRQASACNAPAMPHSSDQTDPHALQCQHSEPADTRMKAGVCCNLCCLIDTAQVVQVTTLCRFECLLASSIIGQASWY
jgi:hypothetical protein